MKIDRASVECDPLVAICGGGGVNLKNSVGNARTADYLKVTGELDVDLRSNIAAEARAKIVYERLIELCDDQGTKDALQFLMTREFTHMKAFMTALDAMNKPPLEVGLIRPTPKIVDQYFNTSTGAGEDGERDLLGPWNEHDVERVDAPAFQAIADKKAGTRRSEAIDGPDLAPPDKEAPTPSQKEHFGQAFSSKNGSAKSRLPRAH